MTIAKEKKIWTSKDLELLPEDDCRYEIIKGELFVTRLPHWQHQDIISNICTDLKIWSRKTGLGDTAAGVGLIFSETDDVIPDLVWISKEKLEAIIDEKGHLQGAPELVVEVLSKGRENQQRDRENKLELYSSQGVLEYWIVDRFSEKIEIYQREKEELKLTKILEKKDTLTFQLLPEFSCKIEDLLT